MLSPTPHSALICTAALLLAASATAFPTSGDRVYYSDSKQHLREDWGRVTTHVFASSNSTAQDTNHTLLFCVKQNNLSALHARHHAISDPSSPEYRHHMSFDQVGTLTQNTEGTAAVLSWLAANHVTVSKVTPHGEYIRASAPSSVWEELLATSFYPMVSTRTGKVIRRCREYSLPSAVGAHVQSIAYTTQLPPRFAPRPARSPLEAARKLLASGAAPQTTTLAKINKAYRIDSNVASKGNQSVFESLGQYYSPSDLASFAQREGYTLPKVNDNGGHASALTCEQNPNNCGEANLDIEYITAVAQGVETTFWYVQESEALYYEYLVAVAEVSSPVLVHSISYGSLENELETSVLDNFDTQMMKLGARGITVIVASGDDGVANFQAREDKAQCGYNPSYPASSPYVTSLGATMGIEAGVKEIACTSTSGGLITTGGGFSSHYAQPAYQQAAVKGYLGSTEGKQATAGYAANHRGYPDIAVAGHNYEVEVGGRRLVESGTSAAAPVFAAMVSLVNSARLEAGKAPLGFLNPSLYSLAGTSVFNDVTEGENNCAAGNPGTSVCCIEGFKAAKGWDPVTGMGSVDFANFKAKMMK